MEEDSEIATHRIMECRAATTFRDRFFGLMGRKDLSRVFLLFPACASIHTFFMRGAIDVVFLDPQSRVLAVYPAFRPWRVLTAPKGTRDTLELPPGFAREHRIEPGDLIECQRG
jgi:hypothetical protein